MNQDIKISAQKFTAGLFAVLVISLVSGLLAGCVAQAKPLPATMSAQEIIQFAQEAMDQNQYRAARSYYRTTLERFSSDPAISIACRYELAFIDYKEARYPEARKGLTAVLDLYSGPDAAQLPPAYRILAEKVLAKLPPEKVAKKK